MRRHAPRRRGHMRGAVRHAARHGGVLHGQPRLAAAAHRLRDGPSAQTSAPQALQEARRHDGPSGGGVPEFAGVPGPARRRGDRERRIVTFGRKRAPRGRGVSRTYAKYALWLLTAINLVNYLTRNAIFALFDPVK